MPVAKTDVENSRTTINMLLVYRKYLNYICVSWCGSYLHKKFLSFAAPAALRMKLSLLETFHRRLREISNRDILCVHRFLISIQTFIKSVSENDRGGRFQCVDFATAQTRRHCILMLTAIFQDCLKNNIGCNFFSRSFKQVLEYSLQAITAGLIWFSGLICAVKDYFGGFDLNCFYRCIGFGKRFSRLDLRVKIAVSGVVFYVT